MSLLPYLALVYVTHLSSFTVGIHIIQKTLLNKEYTYGLIYRPNYTLKYEWAHTMSLNTLQFYETFSSYH